MPWPATTPRSELLLKSGELRSAARAARRHRGISIVRRAPRRALKRRRGEGEIIIVNHDGRGWWDATSSAKGDILDLVQLPSILDANFGRGAPDPALIRRSSPRPSRKRYWEHKRVAPDRPLPELVERPPPTSAPGSPAWRRYLTGQRCLPEDVLAAASAQDAVREGYHGSSWFAHRDGGAVSHIEVRGPDYKGSLRRRAQDSVPVRGGAGEERHRLALTEAPIDALSLATIESTRFDTLYAGHRRRHGPGDPRRH